MTIYWIKDRTETKQPYFFSRDTMRFFGQTLKSFHVCKTDHADIWYIWAHGKHGMKTERYFYCDDLYHTLDDAIQARNERNSQ